MSVLILPGPPPRPRRDRPFGGTLLTPTPRGTTCGGMRGRDRDRPGDNRPPGHPRQPPPPDPKDPDPQPRPKGGA